MAERSLNRVELIGRLGRDAETTFTPNGAAITKFTVATSRSWKEKGSDEWKEATDWHNVVLWQSESVASYLLKGKKIFVEGRLQTRSWEKDGTRRFATEVIASNVILLGDKSADGAPQPAAPPKPAPTEHQNGYKQGVPDDDVPF